MSSATEQEGTRAADAATHWQAQLATPPPALRLPTNAPRDEAPRARHQFEIQLPEPAAGSLARLAAAGAATVQDVLLAGFAAMLARTSGQSDLLLCLCVADRVAPLRLDLDRHASFRAWIDSVHAVRTAAEAWLPSTPADFFGLLSGDTSDRFQAGFAFEQEWAADEPGVTVAATQDAAAPRVWLRVDARLFDTATARRMAGHYETLLVGALAGSDRAVATLPLLTDTERRQTLVDWNATQADFPRDACLHNLFEERVVQQPDAIAAIHGAHSLTYRELNEGANRVAHQLRDLGIGPDSLVGIACERSFEMVVGLLAIAKAGGAYVPLDPAYPKERLSFMLADSDVSVLLTQRELVDSLPDTKAEVLYLDVPNGDARRLDDPRGTATAENLAYVIYTSGTTGAPKGVMLDHRGRVNNFLDFNRRFAVGADDTLIALASLSFDMCAYDVFGTLAAGATIALPRSAEMQDPAAWAVIMQRDDVTIWHTAPALLKLLVEYLEAHPEATPRSLRLVLLGGDWIPVSLPDRLRALVRDVQIVSMGGATECSMDSTIYVIEDVDPTWTSIPYGAPMANQRAYVLDAKLQPLPIGTAGELYLGGIGVGRGYLERPELTAERFVADPFAGGGARMYRTGDLVRWMPTGNLELLGRIDNQIKLRGYRIELGEIEALLNQHDAVREGVVVARADALGEKRLIAYVVQDPAWKGASSRADDLGAEQVEQWQAVYDHAYAGSSTADDDPTFNIVSWNSSYTNEPLPPAEMRVWVEQTVERIARHRPDRVMEIGCGMGLLLFRIAPSCSRYIGSDFSQVALDYVARHRDARDLAQVELAKRWADDFDGVGPDSLDAIVLNSIILDFPSMEYLMDVLAGAIEAVRPGGTIFVGDVRSLPLLAAYQTSVQLFQAPGDLATEQLSARIQRLIRQEEELVIEPAFFEWLAARHPQLSGAKIQLKRGAFTNELNAFRYDVTLFVGDTMDVPATEAHWIDGSAGLTFDELRTALATHEHELLCVRNVGNARVARDVHTVNSLTASDTPPSVADLRQLVDAAADDGSINPEDAWMLAEELGYVADIRWSAPHASGRFDVAFLRATDNAPPEFLFPAGHPVEIGHAAADFANNPMAGRLSRELGPIVRKDLARSLPDYMVPAIIVPLEVLPLSPNGKVDRKSLPEPDTSRPEVQSAFVAPRTSIEAVVSDIWSDVLGLDRVGIDDAFLDLGGHSLLAVQIQVRLNDIFPFAILLPDIFESRTVANLSRHLHSRGHHVGIDADEICQMVQMIANLTDEEVAAQISGEN